MDKCSLWLLGIIAAFYGTIILIDIKSYDPKKAYTVVGQVGKCDVIRFDPGPMRRIHYFTRCP